MSDSALPEFVLTHLLGPAPIVERATKCRYVKRRENDIIYCDIPVVKHGMCATHLAEMMSKAKAHAAQLRGQAALCEAFASEKIHK